MYSHMYILAKSVSPKSLSASREKTVAKVSEETKVEDFYGVYLSEKYYSIELKREINNLPSQIAGNGYDPVAYPG